MPELIWISLFGMLGVLSRYGIDRYLEIGNDGFPLATLSVNVLGSLLAGSVYALSTYRNLPSSLHLGLLVGFCGGFTTFSAYTLQTLEAFEKGKPFWALSYFMASPLLGLLGAFIPVLLARRIFS